MSALASSAKVEIQSARLAPLRLMIFMNTLVRGGAEEHVLTLLRGLSRRLFEFSFVCPPALAETMRNDLPADVKLFPLQLRSLRDGRSAVQLAQIIRKEQIDILHSHLFYSSLFASPIGRLCGIPLILETGHGREHWRTGWLKSKFFIDRWVGRFVDGYVAVSEATADYLRVNKGLPPAKVTVIQNGCDLARFKMRGDPTKLKRELGIADDDVVLVVPGRLETQKGHRFLLQAMPKIQQRFPNVRLVFVGDGVLRSELEQMASGLRLGKPVLFVGYQSNINEWYALADVIVMPSLYEGLPLVAIEALAASRPVVATAVDGTNEVIVNGQTGLTVPSADPASLCDAVSILLQDPALRQRLGKSGYDWVWERFTQEQQVQRTQDYYLEQWKLRGCLSAQAKSQLPSNHRAAISALDGQR